MRTPAYAPVLNFFSDSIGAARDGENGHISFDRLPSGKDESRSSARLCAFQRRG
jgi:hypothetical protein